MEMEYNTAREKLIISEYGRNIQKMVSHAIAIKEKEERNRAAKVIIDVMGQLNPHLRDIADFKHKLWDHLFIISNFKLDVDSPYPIPTAESVDVKPERIKYPEKSYKYRHYGKTIQMMIDKAIGFKEGPEQEALIKVIANHLKKSYLTWNKESVADSKIFEDLKELSGGKLKLKESIQLNNTDEILASNKRKKRPPQKTNGAWPRQTNTRRSKG